MKVIVFTDEMKLSVAERLVYAGLPISCVASMLGMSPEKLYYRLKKVRGVKQEGKLPKRKKSITRLETAARLLDDGAPLDAVAHLTGVSGNQILSWLQEEEVWR